MFEIHEFLREPLVPSAPSRWEEERLRILGRREAGLGAELGESVEFEDCGWTGVVSFGGEAGFEGSGGAFLDSTGEDERERACFETGGGASSTTPGALWTTGSCSGCSAPG